MMNTIETRLKLDTTQEENISSCVGLWSSLYRKTWVLFNNKHYSEKEIYHYLMGLNSVTAYQTKSLINKVKTEHSKIKELTKAQLKRRQQKFITKEKKIIHKNNNEINLLKKQLTISISKNTIYTKLNKLIIANKKKSFVVFNKNIKLNRIKKSIGIIQQRIKTNTFKLCFGSTSLFKQQPGHHTKKHKIKDKQKAYHNKSDWQFDWDLSRNNLWFSIGSKEKPQGNAEIQYFPEYKKLRLRLTEKEYSKRLKEIAQQLNIPFKNLNSNLNIKYSIYRMQARFIEINDIAFCPKNQQKIILAINNKQPITAKIIKKLTPNKKHKEIGFYLQLSFDEVCIKLHNEDKLQTTLGIDLNEKGLAYCIVKPDGNKIKNNAHGFVTWNLKTKQQSKGNTLFPMQLLKS